MKIEGPAPKNANTCSKSCHGSDTLCNMSRRGHGKYTNCSGENLVVTCGECQMSDAVGRARGSWIWKKESALPPARHEAEKIIKKIVSNEHSFIVHSNKCIFSVHRFGLQTHRNEYVIRIPTETTMFSNSGLLTSPHLPDSHAYTICSLTLLQ